jgi:uncharacterized SAM-binding protein YcdF (DUF218 family)
MTLKPLPLSAACLVGWLVVTQTLARALLITPESASGQALVVLSGAPVYAERLRHAALLYQQRRARFILLTDDGTEGVWSRALQRRPRMIEVGVELLRTAGVPGESIVLLPGFVSSTYTEAIRVKEFAGERRITSLIVVTSPYHARRAIWMFRRVFGSSPVTLAINPAPLGDQSPNPATWWLTTRGWGSVAGEYLKFPYDLATYR